MLARITFATLLIAVLFGGAAILLSRPAVAGLTPPPTPTLIVTDRNYLPYVRGVVLGPTVTATTPPPIRTPNVTITPSATNTVAPFPTPTLIVTDRNYLPYVRGIVRGPTVTATTPPPTRTPFATVTPSITSTAVRPTSSATATQTATPSQTPSSTSSPTATITVAPTSG